MLEVFTPISVVLGRYGAESRHPRGIPQKGILLRKKRNRHRLDSKKMMTTRMSSLMPRRKNKISVIS